MKTIYFEENRILNTAIKNGNLSKFLRTCRNVNLSIWKDMGSDILSFHKNVQWAWGAWWICGKFDHGERKKLVEDASWEGPSYETLRNYGAVARRFLLDPEMSCKYDKLPFSYYIDLAVLPNEEILILMNSCCKGGIETRTDLQSEIANIKSRLSPETKDPVDLSEPFFAPSTEMVATEPRQAHELTIIKPIKVVNTRKQISPKEQYDSECSSHRSDLCFGLSKIVRADPEKVADYDFSEQDAVRSVWDAHTAIDLLRRFEALMRERYPSLAAQMPSP
jgi:hypothetical protein